MRRLITRLFYILLLIFRKKTKTVLHYYNIVYKRSTMNIMQSRLNSNLQTNQLLKYCNTTVEYYKGKLNSDIALGSAKWNEIPVIHKSMYIANPETFIADNVKPNIVGWNSTSGSSGINFQFLNDRNASIWSEAGCRFSWDLMNLPQGSRELKVWGASRDVQTRFRTLSKLKMKLENKYIEICYNISPDKAELILKRISALKPSVIHGYPNIIDQLIRYDTSGVITSSKFISAGEWLRPDIRKRIETHIGKNNVFDRYGSREFGIIANECTHHNGLHIISPLVYIEVLDESDNPCSPDTEGELVITSFTRRTMPFLRYKIGDRGILSSKPCSCGCGFPLIKKLKGRSMDLIRGWNGSSFSGYFWTHISRDIEGIDEFRIIQNEIGHAVIEIVKSKNAPKNLSQDFKQLIKKQTKEDLDISVNIVKELKYGETGKLKFIESNIE